MMGIYVGKNALTAFWNGIKAKFASVAYSGSYTDLSDTPEVETAASGGTTESLVTTGEKYEWNGKANVVELTQAQYDALSSAEKNNGSLYMITDGTDGWLAEDSIYDNTQSGLSATNVQEAVDELADEKANAADLATVATTGSYNDLSNKPTPWAAGSEYTIHYGSSSYVVYRKIGNIVFVNIFYRASDGFINAWAEANLGTLPEGYRPHRDCLTVAITDRPESDGTYVGAFATGKIAVCTRYNAINGTNDIVRASIVYPVV